MLSLSWKYCSSSSPSGILPLIYQSTISLLVALHSAPEDLLMNSDMRHVQTYCRTSKDPAQKMQISVFKYTARLDRTWIKPALQCMYETGCSGPTFHCSWHNLYYLVESFIFFQSKESVFTLKEYNKGSEIVTFTTWRLPCTYTNENCLQLKHISSF